MIRRFALIFMSPLFLVTTFLVANAHGTEQFSFEVEGPQRIEQSEAWTLYGEYIENFGLSTFARTKPVSVSHSNQRNSEEIFVDVVQYLNEYPVVMVSIGANIDEHLNAYAKIDGKIFPLYVDESLQHLYVEFGASGSPQDGYVIAAMKKGVSLEIHATTYEGYQIIDRYSLMGATATIEGSEALINSLSELMPAYLN